MPSAHGTRSKLPLETQKNCGLGTQTQQKRPRCMISGDCSLAAKLAECDVNLLQEVSATSTGKRLLSSDMKNKIDCLLKYLHNTEPKTF